ncbi:putative ATP-dependent RNA helicase DOB1 [Blattamonas nauphoetae]|uniref:ATP-dependent RNA helicase DOB1 n=1 Tax=Blattamonas nauphoetae TaxID=2049346 RepID=A0ABQ9XLS0_9EUKA|nr:putative ATP-dependent RNA helicase DOB1 [Blattamonas nauphoetae]
MQKDEQPPAKQPAEITLDQTESVYEKPVIATNCVHEAVIPPGWVPPAQTQTNTEPAKTFPFKLDEFQEAAVRCVDKGESVLVSAHTSAGKTVVALYAIATALRANQKVIYTSPIKALSNQKYRELSEHFDSVGLMTGDVTLNETAKCLVMTTEILRNMLYKGSEVTREVAWVIFDEIHYMRDYERGVVWEETIISLPKNCRFVFLSATIPNAKEFAEWICSIHNQPCHVVSTDYRPVPLQHYLFPVGGKGLHLVVDEHGVFRENSFSQAMQTMKTSNAQQGSGTTRKMNTSEKEDIYKIIKLVMSLNFNPCIVFCFSKKEVENIATTLGKKGIIADNEDRMKAVNSIFDRAISTIPEADRNIPQINNLRPFLVRGIGVHHSGLIPVLKEIVELLFQEGLIEVLVATETFAMGLNMPAKTVIFSGIRKFDGKEYRYINGGEYIQMSGRAGRRGLDERGIVIVVGDERISSKEMQDMMKGSSDPLLSQFHLSFNMILNTLRIEAASPSFIISHSFLQFQTTKKIPQLENELLELEKTHSALPQPSRAVDRFHNILCVHNSLAKSLHKVTNAPITSLPFLQTGRVVRIASDAQEWGYGIVVSFMKRNIRRSDDEPSYVVDCLVAVQKGTENSTPRPVPSVASWTYTPITPACPLPAPTKNVNKHTVFIVVPVKLAAIRVITSIRFQLPPDLNPETARQAVGESLLKVNETFNGVLPELSLEDLGIDDEEVKGIRMRMETLEKELKKDTESITMKDIVKCEEWKKGKAEIETQKSLIEDMKEGILKRELNGMIEILSRFAMLEPIEKVVTAKGQTVCAVNSINEVLAAQLLYTGYFSNLTEPQIVAILSVLLVQERGDDMVEVRKDLVEPIKVLQEEARKIIEVAKHCGIETENMIGVNLSVLEAAYLWTQGADFKTICQTSEAFEGSIIRVLRRVDELLMELSEAAQVMGSEAMIKKFASCSQKIKRGIVFVASLYI